MEDGDDFDAEFDPSLFSAGGGIRNLGRGGRRRRNPRRGTGHGDGFGFMGDLGDMSMGGPVLPEIQTQFVIGYCLPHKVQFTLHVNHNRTRIAVPACPGDSVEVPLQGGMRGPLKPDATVTQAEYFEDGQGPTGMGRRLTCEEICPEDPEGMELDVHVGHSYILVLPQRHSSLVSDRPPVHIPAEAGTL
ncbi:hypothetical protein KIPB_006755, partial [Kipferlia bialata]|eukprot:g6755.t1